jgi:7,8-dihydropterin-6-yl-methyl-4-(beta-D-ribofuranosyl)aminobenzene 5'-phosphate synthase
VDSENKQARLTVIIDNAVPIGSGLPFLGEHGLSMLLEMDNRRILMDTGQTSAILNNMSLLGVTPDSLDGIVISHGHYDHTGGLPHLLSRARKQIPVYLHESAFQERFSVTRGERKFVGIPGRKEHLSSLGADWVMISAATELAPGLWLSGSVPRTTDFEAGDARLVRHEAGRNCDCQDELADDMALFYKTAKGLVVISGCTHAGLINMVRHGLAVSGCTRLHGWIGGTHLGPVSTRQQEETLLQLAGLQPDFVAANHCTGFPMMSRLHQAFGDRFIPAFVGSVLAF